MANTAPLFHFSPKFIDHRITNSNNHNLYSSSNSCSSSFFSSSFDHLRGNNWNFSSISGINNIWKHQNLKAQAMSTTQGTPPRDIISVKDEPDHLLVLVHGIMGSPSDWTYFETELKRRLGKRFLIYASSCNTYTRTFTGIDGAGKRLAEEVMQIVKKTESLKRISFLAHSLGGLFARYAIAVLYMPDISSNGSDVIAGSTNTSPKISCSSNKQLIAGLEPVNFITLATPHLGVRGKKQLPFLLGVPFLEKLAAPLAPIFTGRTGSQLFLTDGKPDRPLLVQMASDCEEGKFISALGAFRHRLLYANVSYDHMVGWRTSSIRRETELVKVPVEEEWFLINAAERQVLKQNPTLEKPPLQSLDGYEHVVGEEYCPPVSSQGPHFPEEAAKAKQAVQNESNPQNTVEYHEAMEEEMIRGLQRLGWKKVDVSFHSALWPFFAHNNINVKNEWLHYAGAGVVAHVADSIRQQEKQEDSTYFAASL